LPSQEAQQTTPFGFDEASKQVWVNGKTFSADDHQSALESRAELDKPMQRMPANFRPMEIEEYGGYIDRIKDPSMGRMIKKNFGIGVDNLQLLGGYGMQLAGAEETGQAVVKQQVEDLRFNQPYQRTFTDIDSAGGAVEWFVANLAQQGPNLIESALAAIAGGVAGGVAGGGANPFTALGGAMMALGGKEGVKQSILAIAKKKLAGEALEAGEMKLLREAASGAVAFDVKGMAKEVAARGAVQAKAGGAASALFASNYAIGASDVYGEQLDSGTPNRATALGLAIPYALAESAPELLALGFFAKGVKGGRLKRSAKGLGAGIVGEGGTEAFQETLLLGQNDEVDIMSKEGIHRLVNSFAAGAGVGGALGAGGAFLRKNKEEAPTRDINEENHDLLAITDQRGDKQEQITGPEEQLRLEAPTNIGGANVDRDAAAIDREYAELTVLMDSLEEQLTDPNLDEATRAGAEAQFIEVGERRDIIGGRLTSREVDGFNHGATPIFQGGPTALADPGVVEVTDPANITGPDQQLAAEMGANLSGVQEQMQAQQNRQLPAIQQPGIQPVAPPIAQPDLTATSFALDALASTSPIDPLQAESNAIQDQQFAQMNASLVDQQQGDVRLQEQLPLPAPLWTVPHTPTRVPNRGPQVLTEGADGRVTRPRDEPTLLVPRQLTAGPVDAMPVEEVLAKSRTGMQALHRLATCLRGGGT